MWELWDRGQPGTALVLQWTKSCSSLCLGKRCRMPSWVWAKGWQHCPCLQAEPKCILHKWGCQLEVFYNYFVIGPLFEEEVFVSVRDSVTMHVGSPNQRFLGYEYPCMPREEPLPGQRSPVPYYCHPNSSGHPLASGGTFVKTCANSSSACKVACGESLWLCVAPCISSVLSFLHL